MLNCKFDMIVTYISWPNLEITHLLLLQVCGWNYMDFGYLSWNFGLFCQVRFRAKLCCYSFNQKLFLPKISARQSPKMQLTFTQCMYQNFTKNILTWLNPQMNICSNKYKISYKFRSLRSSIRLIQAGGDFIFKYNRVFFF